MKWSTRELRVIASEPYMIDEIVDITTALKKRKPELIDAENFHIKGILLYEEHTVLLQLVAEGEVVLPSTRSLTPVNLPLAFPIKERLIEENWETDIVDEDDVVTIHLTESTVDLNKTLVDNILIHMPLQVLTAEEQSGEGFVSGNEWQVLSEDYYQKQKQTASDTIDPRLAKLQELFNDEE